MTTTDTDSIKSLYPSLPLRRDAKEIRVFHLNPPNLELPDDPIRGTLEVVNIDARPRFVALSYVWGTSSSPPRTITCAHHQIEVTDNLWNALSHLRHDPMRKDPGRNSDGSLTIWIDAICINQSDEEEKLAQIPLMGDIYGSSFSTCIWLGKGSTETDEGVRLARIIGWQDFFHPEGDLFYKMPNQKAIWREGLRDLVVKTKHIFTTVRHGIWNLGSVSAAGIADESFMDISGSMSHKSLEPILNNIWLWRIWTLQEVALAPNPWIRYGSQCLTWRNVLYSVAYLGWSSRNADQYGFDAALYYRWQRAIDLWLTIAQPPRQEAITYQPAQGSLASSNFELALADYHRFLSGVKSITLQLTLVSLCLFFILIFVSIMIVVNIDHNISAAGLLVARIVLSVWLAGMCLTLPLSRWYLQPQSNVKSKHTILGAVLQEVYSRDATDPRDKACGVHAVLAKLGVHLQPAEKSSTKSLLYRELSLALLEATQNLNLILGAGSFFPDQPSWIPEWALKRTEQWLPPSFWLEDGPDPPNKAFREDFIWGRCTMKSPARFDVQNGCELIVEGFTVGKVSWGGDAFVRVGDDSQDQGCGDVGNSSFAHNIQILQEALRKQREKRKSRWKASSSHITVIHTAISRLHTPGCY